jgi:hypothetical protein
MKPTPDRLGDLLRAADPAATAEPMEPELAARMRATVLREASVAAAPHRPWSRISFYKRYPGRYVPRQTMDNAAIRGFQHG